MKFQLTVSLLLSGSGEEDAVTDADPACEPPRYAHMRATNVLPPAGTSWTVQDADQLETPSSEPVQKVVLMR